MTPARRSFAAILLIVFLASLLAGYLAGEANSPKYDKSGEAKGLVEKYVTRASSIELPEWQVDRGADGQISGIRLKGGILHYSCGFKPYYRDLNKGEEVSDTALTEREKLYFPRMIKPSTSSENLSRPDLHDPLFGDGGIELALDRLVGALPAKEPELPSTPRHGASMNEVIGVMLGGAEIYTVKYAVTETKGYWQEMKGASRIKRFAKALQLVGAGVSGFTLGFYFGYEDSPDCDSLEFKDQLNQAELWRTVGANLTGAYALKFQRDPKSTIITTIYTYPGNQLSLRDSWMALDSVIRIKQLGAVPENFVVSTSVRDKLRSNTELRNPMEYLPFWTRLASLGASYLSKSYEDSRLYLQLTRSVIENLLWVKNDKKSWKPTADPDIEAFIEGYFMDRPATPGGFLLPPAAKKKLFGH